MIWRCDFCCDLALYLQGCLAGAAQHTSQRTRGNLVAMSGGRAHVRWSPFIAAACCDSLWACISNA